MRLKPTLKIFSKKDFKKDAKTARFYNLIEPLSREEDLRRREYILNIILLSLLFLTGIALIVNLYTSVVLKQHQGMDFGIIFFVVFIFSLLYFLSRIGHFLLASYLFILFYLSAAAYMGLRWGINLPCALLSFILIIIASSILINANFSIIITILISIMAILIGYLQVYGIVVPLLNWKLENALMTDLWGYNIIFFVAAVITWLSNREIEFSLKRARRSEEELKKERDLLESKVEERTQEIKRMQMEKMMQLSRNAEFGRLSSGLFHNLINPLTSVSLCIEQIKEHHPSAGIPQLAGAKSYLYQALDTTKRMEKIIIAIRKQLSHQDEKINFSISEEIAQVIQILSYKAMANNIELKFHAENDMEFHGSQIKFSQIAINLISNAIDSYEGYSCNIKKAVEVTLSQKKGAIFFTVQDWGCGISDMNKENIFKPFFTTKSFEKGTGMGLCCSKELVEKFFAGTIEIETEHCRGTKFIVKIPIDKEIKKLS